LPPTQGAPGTFFATQLPGVVALPVQYRLAFAQWASAVQLERQVLLALHTYAPQPVVAAWLHVPMPEQNDAGWNVVPVHDTDRPHDMVVDACWQPPAPLHAPVFPHGGAEAHCPVGAAVPAAMFAHIPRLPAMLHAWQVGQVALPQQTPLTQLPLMHWLPAVHTRPFGFSAQLRLGAVPWQVYGARQSPSAVQLVRHAAPLHR
jgi:hypothetical protein